MKKLRILLPLFLLLSFPLGAQTPEQEFQNPPMKYRPYAWWHWMGSLIDYNGVMNDLEAMKEEGLGGATIFNLTSEVRQSAWPMKNAW